MADHANTAATGTHNTGDLSSACLNSCYIHHKPNGPVPENTLKQALHTHNDTVGFIAPQIFCFMGVVWTTSNDVRVPLIHVFSHHAHQLCLKTQ